MAYEVIGGVCFGEEPQSIDEFTEERLRRQAHMKHIRSAITLVGGGLKQVSPRQAKHKGDCSAFGVRLK